VVYDCKSLWATSKLLTAYDISSSSLPYLLGTVVCAALAGALVSRIGRYWHVIFLSPAFTSIGFGLMYTFSSTTSDSKIIAYQVR
jgi:hypothetical protein